MAEISSPLSRENRLQIARSSFSSTAISGNRSLAISPIVSGSPLQQDPETLRLLENNQNELVSISSGISVIKNSVDSVNESLSYLLNTISTNISTEFNRESQRNRQEEILAQDALRDETEALIEKKAESSINNTVQPIAEKTTGTLNSLMGVFSSLFLGWLGTGGIQYVQSLAQESGDRFNQVKGIVGSSLGFIGDGLSSIKTGVDNTIANITRVTNNIKDAVIKGLITAPFRALFGGGGGGSGAAEGAARGATTPPPRSAAPAAAADDSARGATTEAAESGARRAVTEVGETGIGRFLRGGLVSAAFGGLDFMQRKEEGQTTTQAATGAGGGVLGAEVGALTGARIGSLFGPLGAFGGAVLGGAGGWMFGSGMADRFTGVSENGDQPQQKPQPQPTQQSSPPPPPPIRPSSDSQPVVQPQSPILTPEQVRMSEEKAEAATPRVNFNVNFGDQISNYTNKLFGQSQQPPAEPQDTSSQMPDWMRSMRESVKSFNMPFNFGEGEKVSEESQYRLPEISQLSRPNIGQEKTFGPLPEPPPSIIMAPISSQPQVASANRRFSGSATDVPNISSSNSDNLYVLYSKTQYNVMI